MDKVQKIREELEKLREQLQDKVETSDFIAGEVFIMNYFLTFIDSLQEELVNKDFEMALAEMIDKAQKCVVEPLVVAEQWKDELIKLAKSEEPVSDEQVKKLAESQHEDKTCKNSGNSLTEESETIDFEQELYKAFGQIKDFTLGVAIAKRFYDMGRKHNEPVSEDLEEAAKQFATDTETGKVDVVKQSAFFWGAIYHKQQMMAKAVNVTVHIDNGNYPYIPQIELHDYDKDIPLAKEGDKYKVVLIKEN